MRLWYYFLSAVFRSLLNTRLKPFTSATAYSGFLQSAIVMLISKILTLQYELRFCFPFVRTAGIHPLRTFPTKLTFKVEVGILQVSLHLLKPTVPALHVFTALSISACVLVPVGFIHLAKMLIYTHSLMELSPSWETANCAATQEFPSILWNPKFYCRVHKSPLAFAILSQINPIHIILSYLSKIHFNIVHLLRLGLPTNILYTFFVSQFVLHDLHTSSSLTWSF
jgi:hypothetical protein